MKILLILLFINVSASSYSQIKTEDEVIVPQMKETIDTNDEKQSEEIYTIVEEAPEYPGGAVEMRKYIQSNLKNPVKVTEEGINAKCFIKFVVSSKGDIINIQILKGVDGCKECNEESIRLIKAMPKWKPAKMNGKAVAAYYNLPIAFKAN